MLKLRLLSHWNISPRTKTTWKKNKKKDEKISKLEERINGKDLSESIDELELYSRRNCLLLRGIKEEPKEDSDDVVIKSLAENLDAELEKEDLDKTSCVGKLNSRNTKRRPCVMTKSSYDT